MTEKLPAGAQRIQDLLTSSGRTADVLVLAASTRTADDAAAALNCPVAAIANSLIFTTSDQPILVMTSGAHRVNTKALAERIGVAALDRATPAFVKEATGQTIGGVSPIGHPRPIRTIIDASLAVHERIWVAAGAPNAVFPTTLDDLRALTSGHIENVT